MIDGNQMSIYAVEEHTLRQDSRSKVTGHAKDTCQHDDRAEQLAHIPAREPFYMYTAPYLPGNERDHKSQHEQQQEKVRVSTLRTRTSVSKSEQRHVRQ